MIKIQNYDKETGKLNLITDMSISLANAIRRSVLEIPTMAIDEVEISQNDSALYDEVLAHRMGLIPIKTDKVSSKEIKFKLKAVGPKIVYSTDISPSVGVDYKLPLTILDEGQELQAVATAKLGKGIEHIKHSPGLAYYRYNVDENLIDFITIEEGKVGYNENELKEKCSEDQINKIKKLNKVDELLFNVESWGQIEVKKIFLDAVEILDKNLSELNKAVK